MVKIFLTKYTRAHLEFHSFNCKLYRPLYLYHVGQTRLSPAGFSLSHRSLCLQFSTWLDAYKFKISSAPLGQPRNISKVSKFACAYLQHWKVAKKKLVLIFQVPVPGSLSGLFWAVVLEFEWKKSTNFHCSKHWLRFWSESKFSNFILIPFSNNAMLQFHNFSLIWIFSDINS